MARFSMKDLLSVQSKNINSAKHLTNNFKTEQIPIELIKPSSKNKYGIRYIEELATTIEFVGLMDNLVVKEADENGIYELISGERRYTALKKLYEEGKNEWKTVPCKVEKNESELITELKLLIGNAFTRDLTDWEKTYQANRLKEIFIDLKKNGYKFEGRIRSLVADVLKVSPAQVGIMESINKKLSEDFKGAFENEKITISSAYELSKLPEEKQEEAYQELEEKGSLKTKDIEKYKEETSLPTKEDIKAPISLEDEEVKDSTNITKAVSNKVQSNESEPKTVISETILKLKEHIKVGTEFGANVDEYIVSLVVLEEMIPDNKNFIKEVEERVHMHKNQLSLLSEEQEA